MNGENLQICIRLGSRGPGLHVAIGSRSYVISARILSESDYTEGCVRSYFHQVTYESHTRQ